MKNRKIFYFYLLTFYKAAKIAADYKWNLYNLEYESIEYEETLSKVKNKTKKIDI
jgi:hypothetical protein